MGLAIGDYDRDADLDFFVTHWIAQENALYSRTTFARRRRTSGRCSSTSPIWWGSAHPALDRVGWGTSFIDFDNDGRKDLFVANGHTLEDDADNTRLLPQRMQLFWNRGDEGFFELSEVAGPPFDRLLVARGAATADYDRDGDVDIAVLVHGSGVVLMNNAGTPGAHWVEIDLMEEGGNRHAVGATIRIDTAEWSQITTVGGAASYLSQDSLTAHFGLGEQAGIERVVVRWPDGEEETFVGLAVDTRHELVRGAGAGPAFGPAPTGTMAAGSEKDFWLAYRAGNEARRVGDRTAAILAYERALAIQPTHLDTLHNLAQLRYARGELDVAWDLLERLAAADPRGNRAWQQLSRVAGTPVPGWSIDLDTADAMIDRALQINPGNSESHLLKARWAAYRGDRTTAEAEVEAALGLNPRGAEAYVLAIWLAVGSPDDAAAERLRQRAVGAMCGDEQTGPGCLGDALFAALSAYWAEDGSPRRGRSDVVGRPRAGSEPAPLNARVDLDGDGSADFQVLAQQPLEQVLFARVDNAGEHLPATTISGWNRPRSETAPRPVPWRGIFLEDEHGRGLVLVGGGEGPVRLYEPGDDVWRERPASGLPQYLAGAVIAAADWNGDGSTDLFLADVVDAGAASDTTGRIYWRRGANRFEADTVLTRSPVSAALAFDADGDGDADLVTARALPSQETAVTRLLRSAGSDPAAKSDADAARADTAESDIGAEPRSVLTLWRNEGSRLREDADAMPSLRTLVQDVAVVGSGSARSRMPDLWVATGGLEPERVDGDVLLVNQGAQFVDGSSVLADALRWRRTLRAWSLDSGGVLLLRGGMTPADAPVFVTIPPRPDGTGAPLTVSHD